MKRNKQPLVEPMKEAKGMNVVSRILKVESCTNLSGKSNLVYHIGYNAEQEICIRVASNDGGGYFSPEWIGLKDIQEVWSKTKQPLTSFCLHGLFQGKSANSHGFLFAALLNEGLVERNRDNPRVYVTKDTQAFMAEITSLVDANTNIDVAYIPVGRKTAPPVKKLAPSKSSHTKAKAVVDGI